MSYICAGYGCQYGRTVAGVLFGVAVGMVVAGLLVRWRRQNA